MPAPKSIGVDAYILDVLMPDVVGHDKKPSAFLVYLFLYAATRCARGAGVRVGMREIADKTGLSKSAVQLAVDHLLRRQLISVRRRHATAVADNKLECHWRP